MKNPSQLEQQGLASALAMVDLRGQYLAIKDEIDHAIQEVIDATSFIKGPAVSLFECELAGFLEARFVVGVGNGTDALQIAYMAAGVGPGDEVITSPFSFIATAEAAALLGARPVFVDIDPKTFNIDPNRIEGAITSKTKAIVPVHLFGQPADMDPIMAIAKRHGLFVIEDNAQSVGSIYKGRKTGGIGHIGCISFFPSKNLGCYGDGGAVVTNDPEIHERIRMIANHGGRKKYHNEIVGMNSRLDSLQAAVLRVKLRHLDAYTEARRAAAQGYDTLFAESSEIVTPYRAPDSLHVFHQYTVRVTGNAEGGRDEVAAHLKMRGVPYGIYYPVPMHRLPVFGGTSASEGELPNAERAAEEVLSLPMHTELTDDQIRFIAEAVHDALPLAETYGR